MKNIEQQLTMSDLFPDDQNPSKEMSVQYAPKSVPAFPADLISDFDAFLAYCRENSVTLSKKNELISRKHLVELNQRLHVQALAAKPSSPQVQYPYINFLFHLAISSRLLQIDRHTATAKLIASKRLDLFEKFNDNEKYYAMLEALWIDIDWDKLKESTSRLPVLQVTPVFSVLCKADTSKKIVLVNPKTDIGQFLSNIFIEWHHFLKYFEWLGFWNCEDDFERMNEHYRKGVYFAKSIIVTEFGKEIMSILLFKRNLEAWNITLRKTNGEPEWFPGAALETLYGFSLDDTDYEHFADEVEADHSEESFRLPFQAAFPGDELQKGLPRDQKRFMEGVYTFKVSFERGIWRKMVLPGNLTMHKLHECIVNSFDFDDDHLYSFFMDNQLWSRNCIASPLDDFGHPDASKVRIDSLGLLPGQQFLYLYDYGDEWTFEILMERIDETDNSITSPFISASKGKSPAQYYMEDDEWE
ncbi:plasmid pRiA4b ORF-3 family protein [Sporosarcina cascadiensis]|uniref:plasmid pRiA4b ORF-3 family protein n=1 Tax=Sporosarcina cascadiensis TaxID=2660747 RepID=UPI0018914A04|nr:plasmid pRiA4b ORF-3 family protein [Sporosarcina cascadiensis]